jgi:hypothetical protein
VGSIDPTSSVDSRAFPSEGEPARELRGHGHPGALAHVAGTIGGPMTHLPHVLRSSSAAMMLLVVSVGVNVLQTRRILALVDPPPVTNVVGHAATPIHATSLSGEPVTITVGDGAPTLLYYFSPTCVFCERNWNNVRALSRSAHGHFRIVALAAENGRDLADFVREHTLTMEVYGGVSAATRDAYGLRGTPHSVVISSQGLISHEWEGVYTGRTATQIERLFDVVLPGLPSAHAEATPRR